MSNSVDSVNTSAPVEKRYAIWKGPAPEILTLEDARASGQKLVAEKAAEKVFILEFVEVVEPVTRIVRFEGK